MSAALVLTALLGLVQPVENLNLLGCEAARRELAIVLYVSRSDCTFCRGLEKDILGPLLKSGVLEGRVLIRELISDSSEPVADFQGHPTTAEALAATLQATLTPTLLFLDGAGEEVEPRIVGYQPSDFYSYYLEAAVESAAAGVAGAHCIKVDRSPDKS